MGLRPSELGPLRRARLASIGIALAVGAMGAVALPRLEVSTEITEFLPAGEERELAHVARVMSASGPNRTITLTVAGERRFEAADELARRLSRHPGVDFVRTGPSGDLEAALYELYFPRRYLFYTDDPDRDRLDDERLRAAARDLRQRLASPAGTLVRELAPADPLLAFGRQVERLRQLSGAGLSVEQGRFVTPDGEHAVLFVGTHASPFDDDAAQRVLAAVDRAVAAVRGKYGDLRIEESSLHRHVVTSARSIRADIERISMVSTVLVVVLFLVVFRSLRYLALGIVPLAVGTVVGLTITVLAFGPIHGLALAFGSTLIGVGVDYVAHYVNHHVLEPAPGGPFASLRRILPGIALGAATTVAGLAGLAYAGFPGVRELAVLASTGVLAALVATCALVPPWMPREPRPTRAHLALARALSAALDRLARSRLARWALPALALLACAVGLPRLTWIDDARALNVADPEVLAQDERVRERVSRMDSGRFVVAFGETEELALRRNDEVHRRLSAARERGEVEAFLSLHSVLWSEAAQRASLRAVAGSPRLFERLTEAFSREGFVAGAFEPFRAALAEPPDPLRWDELVRSPLGPLVSSLRIEAPDGRVGFVTLIRGADVSALEARLADLEGVTLFDQARFMAGAYGQFRTRTLQMLLLGMIGVFLTILAKYRRVGLAVAAFAPALLASATALATVALLGYEASLMHVLALLLVLSMGEDYGVFMVEAFTHRADAGNALASVVLACLTTVVSFGLLAMSENPALRALGLVTGLGVLFAFLLAPVSWSFLAREGSRGS
ncbi:MAG TPA: MMPL family transporter [Sandaracinaceae bacterium]